MILGPGRIPLFLLLFSAVMFICCAFIEKHKKGDKDEEDEDEIGNGRSEAIFDSPTGVMSYSY